LKLAYATYTNLVQGKPKKAQKEKKAQKAPERKVKDDHEHQEDRVNSQVEELPKEL